MRKYAYIMMGGAFGALLRFAIKNIHIRVYQGKIRLIRWP